MTLNDATLYRPRTAGTLQLATPPAERYQARSEAPNTQLARRYDWNRFTSWCAAHALPHLPAGPTTVARYLAETADLINASGLPAYAPSTLTRWLATINAVHETNGFPGPGVDPSVRSTIQGIRRANLRPVKRAAPLLLGDLRRVLAGMPLRIFPEGLISTRDYALLLIGWGSASRVSELVALNFADIHIDPEDGLILRIVSSKTDQEGRGAVKAIPFGEDPNTCAPCAYTRWVTAVVAAGAGRVDLLRHLGGQVQGLHVCRGSIPAFAEAEAPVFRAVARGGNLSSRRLSGDAVSLVVQRRLAKAGIDPARFSSHSMRAGFVTQSFRAGATAHQIMRQTGHRDPATLEVYARENDPLRENAVTRLGL
jgi:integrase